METVKPPKRITLRISEELHEALRAYAQAQHRSMQSLLVVTIERLTRLSRVEKLRGPTQEQTAEEE
jgi:predicted HicB family RNase H-like nuclease